MEKLLNKYKEIKKTRKGFTLVELLVVIAILAVLASVSVVGYLGFTSKAKDSNAVTELTQIRELMRASLIDGKEKEAKYDTTNSKTIKMKLDSENKVYYISDTSIASSETNTKPIDLTDGFKALFTDLSSFGDCKINVYYGSQENVDISKYYALTAISYESKESGKANWVVSSDAINTGVYSAGN